MRKATCNGKNAIKAKAAKRDADELSPEYDFDFSQAERGRAATGSRVEGSNPVQLDADIAKAVPDARQ